MKLSKLMEHLTLLDPELDVDIKVVMQDDEGEFTAGGSLNSFKFSEDKLILLADDEG